MAAVERCALATAPVRSMDRDEAATASVATAAQRTLPPATWRKLARRARVVAAADGWREACTLLWIEGTATGALATDFEVCPAERITVRAEAELRVVDAMVRDLLGQSQRHNCKRTLFQNHVTSCEPESTPCRRSTER